MTSIRNDLMTSIKNDLEMKTNKNKKKKEMSKWKNVNILEEYEDLGLRDGPPGAKNSCFMNYR